MNDFTAWEEEEAERRRKSEEAGRVARQRKSAEENAKVEAGIIPTSSDEGDDEVDADEPASKPLTFCESMM